ncbi:MAG TPA: NAD+ synthase [Gammaproteobacteria bacterium]|nr:NAD+ synthase [Gammaproteobacteria bacterium]
MTKTTLRIAMAQLNLHIGNITENLAKHIQAANEARDLHQADLVVFPELSLTGYSPEDLLNRKHFIEASDAALKTLTETVHGIYCLVGHPQQIKNKLYNATSLIYNGKILGQYHKQCLPNNSVFDERRYFTPGDKPLIQTIKGIPIGILICEDIWHIQPAQQALDAGARLIVNLNASPFELDKHEQRLTVLRKRAIHHHTPIVYVNNVGGQDELIFDGGSMIINNEGNVATLAPFFKESLTVTSLEFNENSVNIPETTYTLPATLERAYQGLVLAIRDYINKNHMPHVLVGVSGGIDSALTLTLAVDALGKDRVHAVVLPSRHSSKLSLEEANALTQNLGVKTKTIDIEPTYQAVVSSLKNEICTQGSSVTLQNCQARARGILLMALSNESGGLVLTTGNRSELAVGYCTLYGDMAGGFAPLKDVPKTMVYALAHYRNQLGEVIPPRTITRAPTAELAPDQKDQDSLPPYELLDAILLAHLNQGMGVAEMVAAGLPEADVVKVVRLVKLSEYKRKQAAMGPRLNAYAFGKDWRFPVTNGF